MIHPVKTNDSFLADVKQAQTEPERLHVWWLGQSGFLVQWKGEHLLLDPYLSDSLTRKYSGTDKPHVRMTERVVASERLNFIDVVTSSHNHTDHLDGETILALLKANAGMVILVSEANKEFAANRLQIPPERLTGIGLDQPVRVGSFLFNAVPSAHEVLDFDADNNSRYIGLVVQVGRWTLYHPGDTVRYAGMAEKVRHWPIDLAFLPINGSDPIRGVAGNLSGTEAAHLAHDVQAKLAVPCHYEMFEFNTATPEEFIRAAEEISQPYRILKCGERLSL